LAAVSRVELAVLRRQRLADNALQSFVCVEKGYPGQQRSVAADLPADADQGIRDQPLDTRFVLLVEKEVIGELGVSRRQ